MGNDDPSIIYKPHNPNNGRYLISREPYISYNTMVFILNFYYWLIPNHLEH